MFGRSIRVYFSDYSSICRIIRPFVRLNVYRHLSNYPFIRRFIQLFVGLSIFCRRIIRSFVRLFVHLLDSLSIFLITCPIVGFSVHLFDYPSNQGQKIDKYCCSKLPSQEQVILQKLSRGSVLSL